LQSFVDESEREMMHEQIIILQDKVHLGVDGAEANFYYYLFYYPEAVSLFNISDLICSC
jgi:hypothetical protein